jgi:hypothetical protein
MQSSTRLGSLPTSLFSTCSIQGNPLSHWRMRRLIPAAVSMGPPLNSTADCLKRALAFRYSLNIGLLINWKARRRQSRGSHAPMIGVRFRRPCERSKVIAVEGPGRRCPVPSPVSRYFRKSLEADNRMCLCSFMAAEYDDLPEAVKREVKLSPMSTWRGSARCCPLRQWSIPGRANSGRAIFAVVAGAQLMARSRSDILLFDSLIDSYRVAGLLPA